MKKVLIVIQSLYNGGAERSLVNLLNELPQDKYSIDLLLFRKEGMFLNQVPEFINVLDTPKVLKAMYSPLSKSGKYALLKAFYTFRSRVAEKDIKRRRSYRWHKFYTKKINELSCHYDVAIAYAANDVLYFVDEKVNASRKIAWIHNDYVSAGYSAECDFPHLKNMDAIVTISQACKEILDQVFPSLCDRTFNIPNITSPKIIRKNADEFFPAEYVEDEFTILSIGRLSRQKGFDLAINAAAILKQKGIQFKWFIIGNGELYKTLISLIDELDVSDVISFIGTRENPYPYIKKCNVLVQTSRFEGKSMVLDEAKIIGTPIIATDYATVRDQINDNEGMIVPMTPDGIASGIQNLNEDNEKILKIKNYLLSRDYGNQAEVSKYIELIDG